MKIIARIYINSLKNNSYLYYLRCDGNDYVWELYFGKDPPCLTLIKQHWEIKWSNNTIYSIPFKEKDLKWTLLKK